MLPAGKLVDLRRQLHRRRFCPLPEDPGADRLGGDAGPVDGVPVRSVAAHLRICDPGAALDARHDGADLGRRPDHALSRARADVARALRRRGQQPRQRQVDRSRPEVFRARRAVLGHAALRRLADLRLHRHGRALPASRRPRRPAASASCSASCSCSPGSASRSRPCRSTCGRPTSTRARRRRSPRSLPRRRRSRRSRCSPASR